MNVNRVLLSDIYTLFWPSVYAWLMVCILEWLFPLSSVNAFTIEFCPPSSLVFSCALLLRTSRSAWKSISKWNLTIHQILPEKKSTLAALERKAKALIFLLCRSRLEHQKLKASKAHKLQNEISTLLLLLSSNSIKLIRSRVTFKQGLLLFTFVFKLVRVSWSITEPVSPRLIYSKCVADSKSASC